MGLMRQSVRPVLAIAATILVFGALVGGLTWSLRAALRAQILQREAESIHAVALLQLTRNEPKLSDFGDVDPTQDWLAAVLESSRLRGVLAVQLFDAAGRPKAALPDTGAVAPIDWATAGGRDVARARYWPDGTLEAIYGLAPEKGDARVTVPLLEIVVPLTPGRSGMAPVAGWAHYWIDGRSLAREFATLDRNLAVEAGLALAGGAIIVFVVLTWAFRRLARANRRLDAQRQDLARANRELTWAAKTAAIGAISAHLLHGLKNPLAGLEGFVADGAAPGGAPGGEAWRDARETTQRLRGMVNEVLDVLREQDAGSEERVPLADLVAAVRGRFAEQAAKAKVDFAIEVEEGSAPAVLPARAGGLAMLILSNLLTNAFEAAGDGGRVTLAASVGAAGLAFVVADNGAGLPAAVQARLFQPGASTRPGGTGIGLALSQQLARHAGGVLDLEATGPAGTRFRLIVPTTVGT